MNIQLALPGFDMRQVCPLCHRPALLGQYSPLLPFGLCRECSLAEPFPIEVFETHQGERNKDDVGLAIRRDAPYDLRERRVMLEEQIKWTVRNRHPGAVVKYNLSLRQLRNPIRYSRHEQYGRWLEASRAKLKAVQMDLPLCRRCGQAHSRTWDDGTTYWTTCQRCEDELRVEALYQVRGIFGPDKDEPEAIMDRLVKGWPEVFERGVLPDYWYKLMMRAANRI